MMYSRTLEPGSADFVFCEICGFEIGDDVSGVNKLREPG
jgi:hypothetical protein